MLLQTLNPEMWLAVACSIVADHNHPVDAASA